MSTTSSPDCFEWVVVGGGIHGTYIARELLEAGVPRNEITVLDQTGELLASFRRKARACGMETLRSNYVQHVGPSPFGLQSFAEAKSRDEELIPTTNSQRRPSLDLFLDYAAQVIDRFDLQSLVRETTVSGIKRASRGSSLIVETSDGPVRTARVVLAVGPGERYQRPEWTRDHPQIEHVWDRPVPPSERIQAGETVWVVGGGITAGQFATAIADRAERVVLCPRQPIEIALREADPKWLTWKYIEQEIQSLPPGSRARYDRLQEARADGTMPPYLYREIERTTNIEICCGEISGVRETADGLHVRGLQTDGRADRVVLATGFETVYDHPFVNSVARSLSLERGYRGMPVLDDATLAWRTRDGDNSTVFVTGKLAEGTAGAFAGNIPGARRTAERIVENNPTKRLARQVV